MEQKLYSQMTPDEQLNYVTNLTQFCEEKLPVLEKLGDAWELSHRKDMETGLKLMGAFAFAREFVDKAVRYGDYAARVYRLRTYFDKIKSEVAKGLAIKGSDGHTYALVAPTIPARRRGRPSAAEIEARTKGIEVPRPTDPEMEKQMVIAKLMGVEVIVSNKAPREKNNAEIAAEKAAKKAEYEKQNPSLFPEDIQPSAVAQGASVTSASDAAAIDVTTPPAGGAGQREGQSAEGGLTCPTMSEVYQDRIEQDRLRLSDLAWLCSDDLREQIAGVRNIRVAKEAASERAKLLAEQGAAPEVIEPYAQQAKDAAETEATIYERVDVEMATVFARLQQDEPYKAAFQKRFRGVDLIKVAHITRPYYEKMRSPEFDLRIRSLIEQDSPEYAAKMKAEEEKKQELQALYRYIVRKDKEPSNDRVRTMTERINRVREIAGDKVADSYLPILAKTKEDNIAWRAAKGKTDAAEPQQPEPPAKPKAKKSAAKKPAAMKTTKKKDS